MSPMSNKPLKDKDEKLWSDKEKSQLAEPLKNCKPGERNPLQEPLKFAKKALASLNPTERGLKPEEMIGWTLLLLPTADSSCH